MPSFVTTSVATMLSERPGLQRVELADGSRAVVLTQLTGPVTVGDEVIVNTTAVELGLGTGGWHIVHWNLARRAWGRAGPGHVMKLRYTSLQADVGVVEERAPTNEWPDLGALPVVVCGLHSQVGIVAAALRDRQPGARVVYVMTDGGALPLALSDLVAALRETGVVDLTVTAGHTFGGDLEAVTVPSALEVAVRVAGADVVIVGMGPGVVGTGSMLGTTAVEVAPIIDAVAALGGQPVVAARSSGADERDRHRGLSHHTTTALRLASRPAMVGHAAGTGRFVVPAPHVVVTVPVGPVGPMLDGFGLEITTMGRGPADDPISFVTAAAAGVLAGDLHDAAGYGAPVISQEPGPGEPGPAGMEGEPDAFAAPDETARADDPADVADEPVERGHKVGRAVREWVLVIGGALVVALLIRTFLFQAYEIPSPSMVDTLKVGDRVLVNKLSYKLHDVHRHDVVVFKRPPGEPDPKIKDLIKRVIGLPGETLEFKDCKVFISGTALDEPYTNGQCTDPPQSNIDPDGDGIITVPDNMLFVMGDNRGGSFDSRYFGAVTEASVVGRAFVIMWPFGDWRWL